MKTINFKSEIGINKGYNQENNKISYDLTEVGTVLQNAAKKHFEKNGLYISTVVSGANKTIYNTEWGCPVGGETTYTVAGVANPAFTPNFNEYKKTVLMLMFDVKAHFEQSTVSVEFNSEKGVDFYYLTDEKSLITAIKEINY